jgi:diaminopimelate epimerase
LSGGFTRAPENGNPGVDNSPMRIAITKMHGAGNDFVVLDETDGPMGLSAAQFRWLADRHVGVGADQILIVGPSPAPEVDFSYRIVNADGSEVEQCGNGARCFVRYVREQGLTGKTSIRVRTSNADLVLHEQDDGRVSVDMGLPRFAVHESHFNAADLTTDETRFALPVNLSRLIELDRARILSHHLRTPDVPAYEPKSAIVGVQSQSDAIIYIAIASMGNPHAVCLVRDVREYPVDTFGPLIQSHSRFAFGVNAGFMQVSRRNKIKLRVFERGAGETLACGTGACAAVACGIRAGWLDRRVDVHMRGGVLTVEWPANDAPLIMTGPATTVFHTQVDVPDFA